MTKSEFIQARNNALESNIDIKSTDAIIQIDECIIEAITSYTGHICCPLTNKNSHYNFADQSTAIREYITNHYTKKEWTVEWVYDDSHAGTQCRWRIYLS